MPEKLKQKILEFVAISKECPDKLQEKCFELLLANYLEQLIHKTPASEAEQGEGKDTEQHKSKQEKEQRKPNQEDILETNLHIKVKQFLKKYSLTVDNLNQIFYKEDDKFLPLYDDIKTTKSAESQIRIALLQALLNSMTTGDFEFNGESVREEAQMRKCYDMANFAKIFRTNSNLFEEFDKYEKSSPTIRLSSTGKERLAEVIKELQ